MTVCLITPQKKTIKTKGNRKPNAYYLPEPDLSVQLKRMVTAWCEDRKMLFSTHPDTEHRWIEVFLNEPEQLIAIELGMKQLADGLGLSEETPLYNLGVSGFTSLVAVLSLRKGYRVAEYAFLKEGHIIDRYTIKNRNGSALQLFNKVNTKDDEMDREVEWEGFETDPNRYLISKVLLGELNNIKARLDSEIFREPTRFELYIKHAFNDDLKNMKASSSLVSRIPKAQFLYGGNRWEYMETDLAAVLPVNRKYFCVCLFMLEVFRSALSRNHIDAFIKIQRKKDYPQFGRMLSGACESETACYLLERPTEQGVDFEMISDFELQEFVADMFDLIDATMGRDLDDVKMYETMLADSGFHADYSIFKRLQEAMQHQVAVLSKRK